MPCAFENGSGGATGLRSPFEKVCTTAGLSGYRALSVDFEKASGDASVAL